MDKYKKHIKLLKDHPEILKEEWSRGRGIFDFIDKRKGKSNSRMNMQDVSGCLTQIRSMEFFAVINGKIHNRLTKMIKKDKRIPKDDEMINPKHYKLFAKYHRLADKLSKKK